MQFRRGTILLINGDKYTVTGSGKLRKTYFYNIKDKFGKAFSINRSEVLYGIEHGSIKIATA